MISDNERREVARKLRELPDNSTYPDLIGAIADHDGWYAAADAADRLADLIEPSCDRDVLLVLADEMDEVAQHRRSMGYEGFAIGDKYRARLIRKALGVQHA